MGESLGSSVVSLSLDLKKNRIRIHKSTIHLLGNPTLIQLLFNPCSMTVAIVCPDSEVPGGQEMRIRTKDIQSQGSIEFYSKMFFQRLRMVYSSLNEECTYRLTGELIPEMRAAYFPMSSLKKIELDEGENGNG